MVETCFSLRQMMRWEPSVQKSDNSHWHCFFKLRLGTQHCTLLLGSSGTCGSVTNTHPGPSQTASYPTARFLVQDQIHMVCVNFWCREVKKNCYRRQARANYISHALCHFDSINGLTISLQIRVCNNFNPFEQSPNSFNLCCFWLSSRLSTFTYVS